MSLELRDRSGASRCPYCFDQLELPDLARVECPGCRTQHHQICLEELGGCTVQGCPEAGSGPPREADTIEAVRDRIRERARRFAKNRERYGYGGPPVMGPSYAPTERQFIDVHLLLRELLGSATCAWLAVVGFILSMIAIIIWAAVTGA